MNTPPSTPAHSSLPSNRLEMPPPPPGPLRILYSTFEALVKQLNPVKSGVKGLDIRKELSQISEKDWIQFGSLEITQRAGSGQVRIPCTRALTDSVRRVVRDPKSEDFAQQLKLTLQACKNALLEHRRHGFRRFRQLVQNIHTTACTNPQRCLLSSNLQEYLPSISFEDWMYLSDHFVNHSVWNPHNVNWAAVITQSLERALEFCQRPDSVARSDLNEIVYQTKVILERRQWKPFKDAVASLPTFQKHEAPTILKIALSKLTFNDFTQLCRSGDPGSPMPRTLIGWIIRVTQSVNADTTLRKSPKPPIERIRQANYFIVDNLNKIGIHCRTVLGDRWVHIWQASTREVQDYSRFKVAVKSIPSPGGHGFAALLRAALLKISLNNFSENALRSEQLTSLATLIEVAAGSVTEVVKAVTQEGNSVETLSSLNETMDRDLLNVDALCMVIFGPRVWVPVRRTTADSDLTTLPPSQRSLGHSRLAFRPMRRIVTHLNH